MWWRNASTYIERIGSVARQNDFRPHGHLATVSGCCGSTFRQPWTCGLPPMDHSSHELSIHRPSGVPSLLSSSRIRVKPVGNRCGSHSLSVAAVVDPEVDRVGVEPQPRLPLALGHLGDVVQHELLGFVEAAARPGAERLENRIRPVVPADHAPHPAGDVAQERRRAWPGRRDAVHRLHACNVAPAQAARRDTAGAKPCRRPSATPAGWASVRKNSSATYTGNPRSTCVLVRLRKLARHGDTVRTAGRPVRQTDAAVFRIGPAGRSASGSTAVRCGW